MMGKMNWIKMLHLQTIIFMMFTLIPGYRFSTFIDKNLMP